MSGGDGGFVLKDECKGGKRGKDCRMPAITFSTFVMSLSTSALVQMGEVADPVSGETARDLGLAKQTIDLITMLQEKTRGNLDNEEEHLLKGLLHDLRLAYVRAKG